MLQAVHSKPRKTKVFFFRRSLRLGTYTAPFAMVVALLMMLVTTMAAPIIEAQQVSRNLARNRQPAARLSETVVIVMTFVIITNALALCLPYTL